MSDESHKEQRAGRLGEVFELPEGYEGLLAFSNRERRPRPLESRRDGGKTKRYFRHNSFAAVPP
jgi:hypothetical protein